MKTYSLALIALVVGLASPSYGVENEAVVAGQSCVPNAEQQLQLDQEMDTLRLSEQGGADDFHRPVWHCSAYPNGQGHGHAHEAFSYIYSRAYNQALRSCQAYHGWCHVHCHQDHH